MIRSCCILFRALVLVLVFVARDATAKCYPGLKCLPSDVDVDCICPKRQPPLKDLSPQDTPQFILITNDDWIIQEAIDDLDSLIGDVKNSNGCEIPVTWFAAAQNSNCTLVRERYARGDEIAAHTADHIELTPETDVSIIEEQVYSARKILVERCGIAEDEVVGWRSPYLSTHPNQRQVLYEAGYLYDSSVNTQGKGPRGNRMYPFTLHAGIPGEYCNNFTQRCLQNESYPGFWEVPVWAMMYGKRKYPMDPGLGWSSGPGGIWGSADSPAYGVLKYNFDLTYNGNRAPLPVYVHHHWFATKEHVADGIKFIKYALSKPGVYFVTMRQLIEWMKDPQPISRDVSKWLKQHCGNPATRHKFHYSVDRKQRVIDMSRRFSDAKDSRITAAVYTIDNEDVIVAVIDRRSDIVSAIREYNTVYLLVTAIVNAIVIAIVVRRRGRNGKGSPLRGSPK